MFFPCLNGVRNEKKKGRTELISLISNILTFDNENLAKNFKKKNVHILTVEVRTIPKDLPFHAWNFEGF